MYIADEIRCLEGTAENGVSSVDAMKKKSEAAAAVQQEGRGPQHMPIGEFGGAPAPPGQAGPILAAPMYWFYEMSHAALNPSRAFADVRLDVEDVLGHRDPRSRGGCGRNARGRLATPGARVNDARDRQKVADN